MLPGEWVLKLWSLLKKLKKMKYSRYFSLKIDISKADLADADKVAIMIKKARTYYKDYYLSLENKD